MLFQPDRPLMIVPEHLIIPESANVLFNAGVAPMSEPMLSFFSSCLVVCIEPL